MKTSRIPWLLALAVIVLSAAAAPAPAEAARLVTYRVVVQGTVDADHTDRLAQPGGVLTTTGTGTATFKGEMVGLRFLDGVPQLDPTTRSVSGVLDIDATTSRSKTFDCGPGCPPRTGKCTGGKAPDTGSFATFGDNEADGSLYMQVNVSTFRIEQTCSGDLFGPTDDFWLEGGGSPVYADVSILPSELGNDTIVRRFKRDPAVDDCPNRTPQTISCTHDFSGTVTLQKTGDEQRSEVPSAPPAPRAPVPAGPAPTPAPPVTTPTPAPPVGPVAPPKVTTGKLPPKLSAYEVAIRCKRVGCGGTVKAYPKPRAQRGGRGRTRAAAAPKPLATARFTSATDTAKARLAFDAADRAAIRRAGGIRLVVTTTDAPAVTRTVSLPGTRR